MAVTITVDDVLAIQPSSLPPAVIQIMIDAVSEADACLDANGVSDANQTLIKLYAVAHQLYSSESGGIKAERSPLGDSVTYTDQSSSGELSGTKWGQMLLQIDSSGCVSGLLSTNNTFYFKAIG